MPDALPAVLGVEPGRGRVSRGYLDAVEAGDRPARLQKWPPIPAFGARGAVEGGRGRGCIYGYDRGNAENINDINGRWRTHRPPSAAGAALAREGEREWHMETSNGGGVYPQ